MSIDKIRLLLTFLQIRFKLIFKSFYRFTAVRVGSAHILVVRVNPWLILSGDWPTIRVNTTLGEGWKRVFDGKVTLSTNLELTDPKSRA